MESLGPACVHNYNLVLLRVLTGALQLSSDSTGDFLQSDMLLHVSLEIPCSFSVFVTNRRFEQLLY